MGEFCFLSGLIFCRAPSQLSSAVFLLIINPSFMLLYECIFDVQCTYCVEFFIKCRECCFDLLGSFRVGTRLGG